MRMSGLALPLVWKVTVFFHSCVKSAAITPFPLPESHGISHLPVPTGVQLTVTSGTQVCLLTISGSSGCRISAAHEVFSLFKHQELLHWKHWESFAWMKYLVSLSCQDPKVLLRSYPAYEMCSTGEHGCTFPICSQEKGI